MSINNLHIGKEHLFTSNEGTGTITLIPGPGENMVIEGTSTYATTATSATMSYSYRPFQVLSTEVSTGNSTGALIVSGGIGVAGKVYAEEFVGLVSGTINGSTVLTQNNTTNTLMSLVFAGSTGQQAMQINSGVQVNPSTSTIVASNFTGLASLASLAILSTNATFSLQSTNSLFATTSTNALFATQSTNALFATQSTNALFATTSSAATLSYSYQPFSVVGTEQSTNFTSGALVVAGGVGVTKNVNLGPGSTLSMANSTISLSTTHGAFVVAGGVGVNGNIRWNRFYGYILGTGAQTISNNTTSLLTSTYWNGGAVSSPSGIGFGSGTWTVTRAGWYGVTASVGFAASVVGQRSMFIAVDENLAATPRYGYVQVDTAGSDRTGLATAANLLLVANQKVSVAVFQNSGGNLNMEAAVNGYFSIVEL